MTWRKSFTRMPQTLDLEFFNVELGLTRLLGYHLDDHQLPMHHRQASHIQLRSVLSHLLVLFPSSFFKYFANALAVSHQAPQCTLTPPPRLPPLPPLLPRALLARLLLRLLPPQPQSLPHLETASLSLVLVLLVSSASPLTSCKRLASLRNPIVTNVRISS